MNRVENREKMELTQEHYRVGKVGYDAYCKQTGGVSLISGDKLPEFDVLKPAIQDAWAAVGIAIHLDHWRHSNPSPASQG